MRIEEVIVALEKFAPLPLQESYDNAGLQVGLTKVEVSGALLCLDVTEECIDEAVQNGCNLIVAHHPLLFRGLKQVSDATLVQRCVRKAIRHDITIYAAHTNLDNTPDGVNAVIAEKLGLTDVRVLRPMNAPMAGAGSGLIGHLPRPLAAIDALRLIKTTFGAACVQHNALLERPVQRIALCGGSGSFLLDDALAADADLFLTGEMGYHDFFGFEQKIQLAVIGHYESEQFTVDLFHKLLGEACPALRTVKTALRANPIHYL